MSFSGIPIALIKKEILKGILNEAYIILIYLLMLLYKST